MGGIVSKQIEIQKTLKNETNDIPPQHVTPKNLKTLPFDPRSPTENFSRTPITITDSTEENGTSNIRKLKALPIDPRSPTTEVTRTPLYVEENDKKKYHPLKPSKLAEISFSNNTYDKDPRSPTEKVPRTPLEESADIISSNTVYEKETNQSTINQNGKEHSKDPKINLNKKLFDSLEKDRKPLTDVQNQPKNQLQAMQCRSIEEEFAKNEKIILNKLEVNDQGLKTATDFIENI